MVDKGELVVGKPSSDVLKRAMHQSCDELRVLSELRNHLRGDNEELWRFVRDLLWQVRELVKAGEEQYGEDAIFCSKELEDALEPYSKAIEHEWNEWYRRECT